MNGVENILKKIEQEVEQKKEKIRQEATQKKQQIEENYKNLILQKKKQIDTEIEQEIDLEKKRIYTEKFINYNKKVEQLKNELFTTITKKFKEELYNLDKKDYYDLIKSILAKNLFFDEHNIIVFDTKLSLQEQQKLVDEILFKVKKEYKKTIVEIAKDTHTDFGIKIISGKKKREFNSENIIEVIIPYIEQEINNIFSQD